MTMIATETKYDRLPKWAQDEIRVLRANLDRMTERAQIVEQEVDSSVKISDGFVQKAVPDDTRITFILGGGHSVTAEYRANEGNPYVYVSGSRTLRISPRASNVVYVQSENY